MRESLERVFSLILRASWSIMVCHLFLNCWTTPQPAVWKCTLNHKIHEMVETFWKSGIKSKSSTKYLNPGVLKIGSSHCISSTVRNNIHDSRRAQIKCKLLTGTYIL